MSEAQRKTHPTRSNASCEDQPEESHEEGRVGERSVYAEVWHSAALVVLTQRSLFVGEPEVRMKMTPWEARQLSGLLMRAANDAEDRAVRRYDAATASDGES